MTKIPVSAFQTPYVRSVKKTLKLPDTMAKTILCTIDFSDSSRQALEWAVTIARQMKAHLTVLYTFRLLHARNGEVLNLKREMEQNAYSQFASLEKDILYGKGISYDFRTEIGFTSDRIEDHARKNSLNFLIMDKNISSSTKENFDQLMEHLQVPTLLIP